jgi:hypothetical protein
MFRKRCEADVDSCHIQCRMKQLKVDSRRYESQSSRKNEAVNIVVEKILSTYQ